jgi:hypothetical protein
MLQQWQNTTALVFCLKEQKRTGLVIYSLEKTPGNSRLIGCLTANWQLMRSL